MKMASKGYTDIEVNNYHVNKFEELAKITGEPVWQIMDWFIEEHFDAFEEVIKKDYIANVYDARRTA